MGGQGWTSLFSPDIADSRQMKRTGPGLSAFLRPWETLVQGRASGVLRSSGGKKLFRGRHWGPRDERQCPRERLAIAAVTPLNFSALALWVQPWRGGTKRAKVSRKDLSRQQR